MTDQTPALTDAETAADFIRRLLSAWECCATCAGGVLKERDASIRAEAVAAARAEAYRHAAQHFRDLAGDTVDRRKAVAMLDDLALRAALAEGKGGECA